MVPTSHFSCQEWVWESFLGLTVDLNSSGRRARERHTSPNKPMEHRVFRPLRFSWIYLKLKTTINGSNQLGSPKHRLSNPWPCLDLGNNGISLKMGPRPCWLTPLKSSNPMVFLGFEPTGSFDKVTCYRKSSFLRGPISAFSNSRPNWYSLIV